MEKKEKSKISSTEAVLFGALAPGVNVCRSNMEHSEIRVSSAGSLSRFYALFGFHQWPINLACSCLLTHYYRLNSLYSPQLVSCSDRLSTRGDTNAGAEFGT